MHFMDFEGIAPKIAPKALKESLAVKAENLDVYGTRFFPFQELGAEETLLTVDGEVFTGRAETIYQCGTVFVAFPTLTHIAPDPIKRLGNDSFVFVQDGKLFRQSSTRILHKKPPIQMGMQRPDCCVVPQAEVIKDAGCKTEFLQNLCVPESDENCNDDAYPCEITAYKFTYVNACEEESADSMPSNYVEVENGDAVKLSVKDTPPANAIKRRWYRAVADEDGGTNWLYVGTTPIAQTEFYDTVCPLDMGNVLETEQDDFPTTCIEGVAPVGNLRLLLWGGDKVYVSHMKKPHAYPARNEQTLRFDILRAFGVTEKVEGQHSHQVLLLTKGLHYRITVDEEVGVSEYETRFPLLKAEHACANEVAVYYLSTAGVCEFTVAGVNLVSAEFFTEREFKEFLFYDSRPVYFDDRLFVFGRKSWVMALGADNRREPSLVTLSTEWDFGWSNEQNRLLVHKYDEDTGIMNRWFAEGQERLCGVWRSKPIMMSGFWRPVSFKVVSQEFSYKSAFVKKARHEMKLWLAKRPMLGVDDFLQSNPQYEKYRTELEAVYPTVEVIIYADGKEYYRCRVSSNRPHLIPRKYKALDWQVEVRSRLQIDEIHLQTSRESLLQEG